MYECKSCMFVSHTKNHYSKHLQTRKHIDIVQINERFITEEKEIHVEEEDDGTEAAFEDDFFSVQLTPFLVKRAGYKQEVVQLWCMLAEEIIELINRRQLKEPELAHLEDIQIMFNQKVFDRFPDTKRKQKMHHNLHTEDNIRMHGVPTEYTTELIQQETVEEICHQRIQSFVFGNQTENNDGDVIYYFHNDQVKFGEIINISTTLIDISRMAKLEDEDRVFNCYKLRKSSDELSLAIDNVHGIVYVVSL
ncbi:unnamed protein product [Mytilus coruscus]|uniref:Uncharacterized protein n=1 Tax=Mytilus coruscus TaxID=42192 RepID=A0A6J8DPE1_MYTCO|nr:unnamed protein product [Mytilus coruscus]